MGGRGRADVATLTNVLNPLKEIKKIILKIGSNFKEGLANFFSPKEGQGNIPFKKELEKEIKENIKQALDNLDKT
jgi:hypothetical protein